MIARASFIISGTPEHSLLLDLYGFWTSCFFFPVGEPLSEDDVLLIEIAKWFVSEENVGDLAAILLENIPPNGRRFVEQRRKERKPWSDIALDVMRTW